MNKNCKKGFTIVELIIVIAVIAILAAVLIPTFSNLIKRANVANDTALVRNLNTALAADGAKQHDTMREALAAANAFGYDVSKINAKADGNEILWDSYNDCFVYKDESGINYIPDSQIKGKAGEGAQLWHIANKGISDISSEYSNYLGEGTYAGTLNVSTGLDVGDHTEVTAVKYTGEGENVIIYMNGGTLTVTETNATAQQYFYGSASQAVITTGTSCFHVYGAIAKTNVKAGKVVAENGGMVIVSEAATSASVEKNGGIVLAASGATSLGSNVALSTPEEKAAYVLEISTAAELASFRDRVNAGMTYEGLTVKLTADIDLSNQGNWTPIGQYKDDNGNKVSEQMFSGIFDGQNHEISGMNIVSSSGKSSYRALFGRVNGTVENLTVKGIVSGVDVAGVVAALYDNGIVKNVNSYVTINGQTGDKSSENKLQQGKAAGIVLATKGTGSRLIENCKNYASISTTTDGASGIICWVDCENTIVKDCENIGNISATGKANAAGIVGTCNKTLSIENCNNKGKIQSASNAGGIIANSNTKAISILNCVNSGLVSGADNKFGEIAGSMIGLVKGCKGTGSQQLIGTIGVPGQSSEIEFSTKTAIKVGFFEGTITLKNVEIQKLSGKCGTGVYEIKLENSSIEELELIGSSVANNRTVLSGSNETVGRIVIKGTCQNSGSFVYLYLNGLCAKENVSNHLSYTDGSGKKGGRVAVFESGTYENGQVNPMEGNDKTKIEYSEASN